jgi:histidinol-phosphate aminotransferase
VTRFTCKGLVPPEIEGLHPYHAPEGEYRIRLDANESPYSLPAAVAEEVREALGAVATNRYPDPVSRKLREAFAAVMGIDACSVMAGNGSDELITLLLAAFRRPRVESHPVVLVPVPSFAMYFLSARAAGYRVDTVPLDLPDLTLDAGNFIAEIERVRPNLVFLAQPNNPTGTLHPATTVEAVLRASSGLVVVDEAYGDFASGPSWVSRLPEFPNLAVLRTLSKVGGAALRCGFLVAGEEVLAEVDKVRGPFNINAYTQAAGERILAHPRCLAEQGAAIIAGREKLAAGFAAFGMRVFPSQANFLLVTAGGLEKELFEHLAAGGIVVKSFTGLPVVGDALRITVGSPEQNNRLVDALR